jgi:hypothetical protein
VVPHTFALWLGGARRADADALRQWAADVTGSLTTFPAPSLADEEPLEDSRFVQAGLVWELPLVQPGSADEQALLGDLRLVLDAATAFTRTHPVEVAVQFGCCELAYVEDGQVDAGFRPGP